MGVIISMMANWQAGSDTTSLEAQHIIDAKQGLEQLESIEPVSRHIGRNMSKASVLFFGKAGAGIALKTYRANNLLARNLAGRSLIAREVKAYAAVAGIPGLPQCYGRVGSFALATEWVDAEPLATRIGEQLDPQIFDRIEHIVADLHLSGVALGDLHHRDVLLGEHCTVWIIDLAAAFVMGERPGWSRRRLFERFKESDIVNLTRMRARFTGQDIEEALTQLDPAIVSRYRKGKRIKSSWDWLRRKK